MICAEPVKAIIENLPKRVLHAGSGGSQIPDKYFVGYQPVTLDIDPGCKPDMVGSMVEPTFIPDECFDAIYTAHTLEHLYPHEVRLCLYNFLRILKPGGVVMIVVPNLEGIKATQDVVYDSPSGPVSGLDMIYGHHKLLEGRPYMAHHCGFVGETLMGAMQSVGFENVQVIADDVFNLIGMANAPFEMKEK